MTELILVRHGETVWHAENRYAGSSDIPLTGLGLRQAQQLASWARHARLDALWCSPMSRARDTAQPAAEATGLTPRYDDRLREIHFGLGEGLTVTEMEQAFPERLDAFREDPVGSHLPGGEHPLAAIDRAMSCLEEITAAYPEGRVLVVAHTTLLRLCLCRMLGIPPAEYRRVFPFLRNAALTTVRLTDGQAALLELNVPLLAATVPAPEPSPGHEPTEATR